MAFQIGLIISVVLILWAIIYLRNKRNISDQLVQVLLADHDVPLYLRLIDEQVALTVTKKGKAHYLSRKIYGYLFTADWHGFRELLKQVDESRLPPVELAAYISNIVVCFFLSGDSLSAQDWLHHYRDILQKGLASANCRSHVRLAQAIGYFYHQQYPQAREELSALASMSERTEFFRAIDNYYLAKIDQAEYRHREEREHLTLALQLGDGSFIAERVRQELVKLG